MASPLGKALPIDDQLAAVSGIVTPSKVPAGHKPRRPTETSSNAYPLSTKICIVCGLSITPDRVKSHFVACVHTNGNPMGAQWWHNFVDAPERQNDESHGRIDQSPMLGPDSQIRRPTPRSTAGIHQNHEFNIGLPSATTPLMQAFAIANEAFAPTTITAIPSTRRTESERSRRPKGEAERLTAVNGVVIPSKVAPGNRPNQGKLKDYISGAQDVECNICGRGFSAPSHARPHFAPCVARNGNPYGVKWDDPYSRSRLADCPVREIHVREPLTFEPANPDLREPVTRTDSMAQSMQQGHLDLTFRLQGSFLPAPSANVLADREFAMGNSSNATLLDMLQAWQDVVASGQETDARNDPGFQDVMIELEERQLIDGNWTWTVSDDQIDKSYVRLVSRPKGFSGSKTVHST